MLPNGIIEIFANISAPTVGGFSIGSTTFLSGLTIDRAGKLYIAQASPIANRIMGVNQQRQVSVAVDSSFAFSLFDHVGLAIDARGDFFIGDPAHHRVLFSEASGSLFRYAGRTDINAFGGDGGLSADASLNTPAGLAVDGSGNLYVADSRNHRIRRVSRNDLIIRTIAGSGGPGGGFSGDGGLAVNAQLNRPSGLAIDNFGTLYIADSGNSRIRRVDPNGIITTVAGSGVRAGVCFGVACYSGDDGPAIDAQLSRSLEGLSVDNSGNLYIADRGNHRVRKVTFNTPPSELPPPTIREADGIGVRNGASFESEIASGTWVTIFGEHLAPIPAPGRIWRNNEIIDGKLPRSLEGVSVRFGGRLGYLFFVGPGQLNVLTPNDLPIGVASVEVETPSGIARTTANVQEVAPAFFAIAQTPTRLLYTAAVHLDGTIVGHPSVIPGSRPARAGDLISIYGTGFGPTIPRRFAGELFDPAPLATPYKVQLNLREVESNFGGIVGPGLYQFNILMPEVEAGVVFPRLEIGGQATRSQMIIATQ